MDALMSQSKGGFCYQDMFTILGGGSIESGGFNTNFCGLAKGYASKSSKQSIIEIFTKYIFHSLFY